MRRSLERWVRHAWTRRGVTGRLLWLILLPSASIFGIVVLLRDRFYRAGWLKTSQLPLPVVSVGNLTIGGTGKTPTTVWLTRELSALGHPAAILSRGYGMKTGAEGAFILTPNRAMPLLETFDAESCADEPLMMSALYGQTVAVSARRYESGRQLWQESPDFKVFVLDDGFQHRELAREVDVVLLGADWQGSLLPAGPFRESLAALERADVILVTAAHDEWRSRLDGRYDPSKVFFGELKPCLLVTRVHNGWGEAPLSSISGAKVLSVSAIANPASFYQMLRDWDAVIVDTLEYPDHHCYTTKDWQEISRRAQAAEKIVTTEKDLVKLVRYPFAMGSLFALRVEMLVERKEVLLERITARLFGD